MRRTAKITDSLHDLTSFHVTFSGVPTHQSSVLWTLEAITPLELLTYNGYIHLIDCRHLDSRIHKNMQPMSLQIPNFSPCPKPVSPTSFFTPTTRHSSCPKPNLRYSPQNSRPGARRSGRLERHHIDLNTISEVEPMTDKISTFLYLCSVTFRGLEALYHCCDT